MLLSWLLSTIIMTCMWDGQVLLVVFGADTLKITVVAQMGPKRFFEMLIGTEGRRCLLVMNPHPATLVRHRLWLVHI